MDARRTMSGLLLMAAVAAPMLIGAGTAAAAGPVRLQHVQTSTLVSATISASTGQVAEGSTVRFAPAGAAKTVQTWSEKVNSDLTITYQLTGKIRKSTGALVDGCLDAPSDVPRAQQQSGAAFVVKQCDGSNSQHWTSTVVFTAGGLRNFHLTNLLSAMSADSKAGNPDGAVRQAKDIPGNVVNSQTFVEK